MQRLSGILLVSGILILCGFCGIVSAAAELKPIPMDLKESNSALPYEDDAFMEDATAVIKTLSNKTAPIGSDRRQIAAAYYRLRDMNISPDLYPLGLNIVAFLYYSAQTGEAYEDFNQAKSSPSSTSFGSDYYQLAQDYYYLSGWFWDNIKDNFPDMTLFTLPGENDLYPVSDGFGESGTVLDGLTLPVSMTQKEPDESKPYLDEEMTETFRRWVEDYVEYVPEESDGLSNGTRIMNSEGVKHARSTWMNMNIMNVHPDFLDTANYISAFFYFMDKAKDKYDDYVDDRTSFSSISNGQENLDESKKYYDEADKALSLVKDRVPNLTEFSLPTFPDLNEVDGSYESRLQQGLSSYAANYHSFI